jgi:DNA-binding response OmpR family regulator
MALLRLLLADDEPVVRRAVQQAMLGGDFEVFTVSRGADVLPLAHDLRPDDIVLYLTLRDANGHDLLVRLKADPETANVPVVIWSGASGHGYRAQSLRLGAAEHIEKGEPEDLLFALSVLLKTTQPLLDRSGVTPSSARGATDFPLETVRNGDASLQIGLVSRRVIYARLFGDISARLGVEFSHRFGALAKQATELLCFVDARDVLAFDLAVRSVIVRGVLAHRHRIRSFNLLWPGGGYHARQMLGMLLGNPCHILVKAAEFEQELQRARDA